METRDTRDNKLCIAALEELAELFRRDKEAGRQFMIEAGFITPKGNVRKPYRRAFQCLAQQVQD